VTNLSSNHAVSPGPGRAWPLLLTLTTLLAGGCGGSLTSSGYSASGTVTWKGQPLDQGSIQFLPEGGSGEMVGTEIRDGHYTLPNPPGLAPGTYQVRINSRSGVNPASAPDTHLGDPKSKERLRPEYNAKSELKAEVTGGGSKTFDFTLK
jgi:hypothetical protein